MLTPGQLLLLFFLRIFRFFLGKNGNLHGHSIGRLHHEVNRHMGHHWKLLLLNRERGIGHLEGDMPLAFLASQQDLAVLIIQGYALG